MAHHSIQSEAISRGARMLRTAFGPAIARFLEDPAVIEVMLNPDGRLWIDRLSSGLADTGEVVSAPDGERIVRLVAHHVGAEVHAGAPRISAELPAQSLRALTVPLTLIATGSPANSRSWHNRSILWGMTGAEGTSCASQWTVPV